MNDNYKMFIETFENHNTKKVVNSLQDIGEYDYSNCTVDDLINIILGTKPKSLRAIITTCYIMGLYAEYLNDDRLHSMIQQLDRQTLWSMAKPNAARKYISYSEFENTYHDIGVYEDLNSLYYQALFRCLYEGIYNDDMSVIKNLKSSDIHGNTITLREDSGNSYDLEISEELVFLLNELSSIDTWERKNRYGVFQMKVEGLYPDSCFKIEKRKDFSEYTYRYSYYTRLRKIAKEYVEFNLLPIQIFVSGIMHRIKLELDKYDISLDEAFSQHNRNRTVGKIIADELDRCNYNIEIRNFREMVKGHLDIFAK